MRTLQTHGFESFSRGLMAAATQQRAGMLLLAIRRDGSTLLIRRDVEMWIGKSSVS